MFEIGERIKIAEKRTSFTWEKFPSCIVWLSLVKPQKSVPILGKVLKEKSHTDEGSDVIPRYQGPAYYSACALALLLKGFPVYGNKAFYKENGQNKCIEWFEGKQHVKYTFFCIYDEIKIESLYQVDEQDLSIIDELRDDTFF